MSKNKQNGSKNTTSRNKKHHIAKPSIKNKRYNEFAGIFLVGVGLFFAFSVLAPSTGIAGYHLKQWLMGILGIFAYISSLPLILMGFAFIFKFYKKINLLKIFLFIFAIIIIMGITHLAHLESLDLSNVWTFSSSSFTKGMQAEGSGLILAPLIFWLHSLLGRPGSYIFLIMLLLVDLLLLTGISINRTAVWIVDFIRISKSNLMNKKDNNLNHQDMSDSTKPFLGENIPIDVIKGLGVPELQPLKQAFISKKFHLKSDIPTSMDIKIIDFQKEKFEKNSEVIPGTYIEDKSPKTISNIGTAIYNIPPLSLLRPSPSKKGPNPHDKDVLNNVKLLEETLSNFGISAKVVQVSKGPAITRYELQPAPGVKVSRIVSLADDIALSLAASDIRIEAPIPGKAAIGVEIPNRDITPVLLREVLESEDFSLNPSKLTIGLGKDIAGNDIISDIAKMPHLLIAGATGSGKSICVNALIISVLYKSSPDQVRMLMIDPKVVELNQYNGIPHLLVPVVTDPKKAAGALNWVVQEMISRYSLFANKGARDLERYNEMFDDKHEKLPQILVIIDELADLMMIAPADVEDAICRLAQMARAAGIHLVIATQRPSVDVITGLIKANIPSRISFAVSSHIDSRTILDMGGAEKLLGRGDMLFYPVGAAKPVRIQGAYVSEKEVEAVVNYIKNQNEEPNYNNDVIEEINSPNHIEDTKICDELLPQAIETAIDLEQISISMIQRRLRVGYARAARLIDEMELRGYISGADGSKPRNVLISRDKFDKLYKEGL